MAYCGVRQLLGPLIRKRIKEVSDVENLPPSPPFIIAANHSGLLDGPALAVFIFDRYRRPAHYITKYIYWRLWGGPLARRWLGMIPRNNKRKAESINEAIKVLEAGEIVGIFPEGTRNPDPHCLLKGKTGAIRLALATGAPLIPVGLINTTGYRFGSVIKNIGDSEKCIRLIIGRPLDLSDFKTKPIDKELLAVATRKLMNAIGALCNKKYPY